MTLPLVPVEGVACPCPGTPHPDGDTVFLLAELPYRGGMIAEREMFDLSIGKAKASLSDVGVSARVEALELEGMLLETYIRFGVVEWTFVDRDGDPVPVTDKAIAELLLANFARAKPIGNKADELYSSAILDPLVARLSKSSRGTPIDASISPTPLRSPKRPKRSKPSSTSTTVKAPPSA